MSTNTVNTEMNERDGATTGAEAGAAAGTAPGQAAPQPPGIFQADIGSPETRDERDDGFDVSSMVTAAQPAATTSTSSPAVRRPLSKKRGRSREPSRQPEVDVNALNGIIQALQNSIEELRVQVKSLKEENAELKPKKDEGGTADSRARWSEDMAPLNDIDKKDVEKPPKYKGDPSQWRQWSKRFKAFLGRRDARWPKILDAIHERSQQPLTEESEAEIFKDDLRQRPPGHH